MKTLYVLRHAKAASDVDDFNDIDRSLRNSGIKDALVLGDALKGKINKPELVLTSDAARAIHTATIVSRALTVSASAIRLDHRLYLPEEGQTLELIKNVDDSISTVMVVGHNPDLSILCSELSEDFTLALPTCGFVAIRFKTDRWKDISKAISMLELSI